jgi:hypothetical protein
MVVNLHINNKTINMQATNDSLRFLQGDIELTRIAFTGKAIQQKPKVEETYDLPTEETL